MPPALPFDNSFAREMEGFFVPWQGARVPAPRMVKFNRALADELGLGEMLESAAGAAVLAGAETPAGATPLAMAYAGHQFGQFSPQLGDGRALLIGEVIDTNGQRRDLHLKGSGRTPFSRGGDGKATLGPVLREYLMGEAMHALGIPTTRALAAVTTGEMILREGPLPGAVLARVAASHLRVGTFEYFAARGEAERVRQLADYAIRRHFPALAGTPSPYLGLLQGVQARQAALVAQWMLVGFIHGVMNTDNMAISGETIDYGPCAFMDAFNPATVFSSIDRRGRYAYANQPRIALWNLARLAESLVPLIDPADETRAIEAASAVLDQFQPLYQGHWLAGMRAKLGLTREEAEDEALIADLHALMVQHSPDFTTLFRGLAQAAQGEGLPTLAALGGEAAAQAWLTRWQARLARDEPGAPARILAHNPVYIARNHMVEAALSHAVAGDMAPFERLLSVLQHPFEARAGLEAYAGPAPAGSPPHRTFCGT